MLTPVMFNNGMQVRHRARPEWGVGSVTRAETITRPTGRDQRLWIKFANAGLKTLLASVADLEIIEGNAAAEHTFAARENASDGGWLGQISSKKPEAAMAELHPDITDPFLTQERRLKLLLGLYRFEGGLGSSASMGSGLAGGSGAGLIDWAVAQSGLDDPLSRFTRVELEAYFKDWARERDTELHRLINDFRRRRVPYEAILVDAPRGAMRVLQKFDKAR